MDNQYSGLWQHYVQTANHKIPEAGLMGQTAWRSPSNIAIVKYWGKHGNQLPNNPSLSFTLQNAHTDTSISYTWSPTGPEVHFRFEGSENKAFAEKIEKLLMQFLPAFPFLGQLKMHIESRNSFPHSSGIASSASSMSALVMCLIDIEQQLGAMLTDDERLRKASYFSRLASGSAARSVFPIAALWGHTPFHSGSHDEYAVVADDIHPVFRNYRDTILIISAGTKAVSSRAGHALMEGNPFAEVRYHQASKNTGELLHALHSGDLEAFVRITEAEALQLHALMMTSEPSFILMQPNTLEAIARIRNFRNDTGIPLSFTLDAGPNVHLLYPDEHHPAVNDFVQQQLKSLCQDGRLIEDRVGQGPQKMI
ncbi:MAG: diphosphomevalonate decarboxylase [Bacteroidia bacterium]|nr:diphosphomevalonate decarboxylase [Bacteroidia bacterium]